MTALGDLEIAHEELQVAEDELSHQRQQVERLVAQHDSNQRWRDHLIALLPVGVLMTDAEGVVLETNASAADLLGMRPGHLPGKPLLVYVQAAHRRIVRDLLSQLAQGEQELRASATLVPRRGDLLPADLIVFPDAGGIPGGLRWVILPHRGPARMPRVAPEPTAARAPGAETADHPLRTATALAQLCTLPVDATDQQRLLGRIAVVVGSAVPEATAVSVTIGDPVTPDRLASDSTDAQVFDGLQLRLAQGPCVDAFREGEVVVTDDITRDRRWPRLVSHASAQSMRSVLALPIQVGDERTGVVNLYATEPGAFTEHAVCVGEVIASAVAAVLRDVNERASLQALVHHLERALNSRAVIEQAKGIVMAHHGGTPDEAFARLVAFSSRQNVKLREIAEVIVREVGRMPLRGL